MEVQYEEWYFSDKTQESKGEDGYKVFSIRIREETVAPIDNISPKTGHSSNERIGIFLAYALDKCVIEEEKEGLGIYIAVKQMICKENI